MADNYLEYKREDYEKKKEQWLRRKQHKARTKPLPPRPEDESL